MDRKYSKNEEGLSVERIAGWTMVWALHVTAVMMLFLPMTPPPAEVPDDAITQIVFIEPPPPPPEPPPPPPPEPQPVKPPTPKPVIAKQPRPPKPVQKPSPTTPASDPPIIVSEPRPVDVQADPPSPPSPPQPPQPKPPADQGGSDGVEVLSASKPPYPSRSMQANEQGTVTLKITVGPDGKPTNVEIQKSSGYRDLDRAAQEHVKRKWRFRATGQVQIGILPVNFTLS